jgi:hypothetical protein
VEAIAKNDGKAHGIMMWWICRMDNDNEILLSCAPKWAHHDPSNIQVSRLFMVFILVFRIKFFKILSGGITGCRPYIFLKIYLI